MGKDHDDWFREMYKLTNREIERINERVERAFEYALRNYATPPIKGEITDGKIKYRGIRKVVSSVDGSTWLEQRGKRISSIIKVNMKNKFV